ncbi:MAG: IPT/TIG domain-containing protein, partial [Anaeromyxobacteraceae bacterium]
AAGVVDVRVTNPDGQTVTLPASFTYVAPPTLASLSPTSGTTAGGDAVTLTGTGFVPGVSGSTVSFGDAAATVTVNSTTSFTATTPPHVAATADVTVTNPDGQVATLAGAFTFNAPGGTGLPPPPSITTLDVTSGPTTGGTRFNINGSFTTGATVTFGGVAGVNPQVQNTGGFVTVTTPQHLAGAVAVSVTDAFGQVATKPAAFTFLGPTPTITAVNIGGAPPQGGTTVLVVGTNFDRAAKVTFGGAASLNVVSLSTQLTVTTPPQPDAREFVPLVVTNPDGQSATATFPLGDFHYGPPPLPTDFFVDGNAASKTLPNGKAGQLIDVVGSGFSLDPNAVPPRGVQVLFSGITADSSGFGTNDARSTPTTLVVGIPKLNPGTYQLIVTNFDGQFARAPGTLVILGP